MKTKTLARCSWASNDPLYISYHDKEWGVEEHNDKKLFEFLVLEGMQSGLSWITVLKKRGNYKKAFDNFNAVKIAKYNDKKTEELLQNPGIIRNRLKIKSIIQNAKAFLKVQKEFRSFDKYIWGFNNETFDSKQISINMSLDMRKRGFNFVGPTICYAFMQAIGLVNDHDKNCFRFKKPQAKLK